MNYNRRSPGGFRSVPAPLHRNFDSPQRWSPGRVGAFRPPGAGEGFRPVGGEGAGDFGFNNHQQLPMSGQKRGFPFSGRGGSPGEFVIDLFSDANFEFRGFLLLNVVRLQLLLLLWRIFNRVFE